MALGGVAQLIDGLDSGIHSRIVADGVFAAGDVVIDGAGQADAGNALIGQRTGVPMKEPSPPMTTSASMPSSAAGKTLGLAFLLVLNSRQRAVYRIVPPRWMISDTLRTFISINFCR